MTEQEIATLLKQTILELNQFIEGLDNDPNFIEMLTLYNNASAEEQVEIERRMEMYLDKMSNQIISSKFSDSDICQILSSVTGDFISKNHVVIGVSFAEILRYFFENVNDPDFSFRNALLKNTEFIAAIEYSGYNMANLLTNCTDEDGILKTLEEYTFNFNTKTEYRILPSEFDVAIEQILASDKMSSEIKNKILHRSDFLVYLQSRTISSSLMECSFLSREEKEHLVLDDNIFEKLSGADLAKFVVGLDLNITGIEEFVFQEKVFSKIDLAKLISNLNVTYFDFQKFVFQEKIYSKLDKFALANIIANSNLTFSNRKDFLFDERVFKKLDDFSLRTVVESSKITAQERLELIFNEKVNKLLAPCDAIRRIFEGSFSKENVSLLSDERVVMNLDYYALMDILSDERYSLEIRDRLFQNDYIFYKLIGENHPQYFPNGGSKGPFRYNKREIFTKLYERNHQLTKTLVPHLLQDEILDLGFDFVELMSKYRDPAKKLCALYDTYDGIDGFYFQNMKDALCNTVYAENIDLCQYIEKLIDSLQDTSYYRETEQERREFSILRHNRNIEAKKLTREQWLVMTQIALRGFSNYYVDINEYGIKEVDFSLNIKVDVNQPNDLDTYNERRLKKCDEIFKEAVQDKDLEKAQNAYFNKYFNINIQEAKEIVRLYGSSIHQIDDQEEYKLGTHYVEAIQSILSITKVDTLNETYHDNKIVPISFDESLYLDQSIRHMFSKNMADSVFKVFDNNGKEIKPPVEYANYEVEIDGKKVLKKIPVYVPDKKFKMLIHSTAAYGELELINNNYFDSWNKSPRVANHGICCSLIANDNMGMAAVNDVLFGFSGWDEQAITKSAPYDLYTNNDDLNIQEGRPLKFMTAQDIIDNTRHTHNEQSLERLELRADKKNKDYPNIQPDYVIIYSDMKEEIKQKALKCASEMDIPIVYLDKKKIVEEEKNNIDEMIRKCFATTDLGERMKLLEKILCSHENNRSGLRMTNPDWLDQYFPSEKIIDVFTKVIAEYQLMFQNTGNLLEYYQASSKIIGILEKEKAKFDTTMETTDRKHYIDLPIEEYTKQMIQFINPNLCRTNTPKLEMIIQKDRQEKSDLPLVHKLETIKLEEIHQDIEDIIEKNLYPNEGKNHNIGHIERVILFTRLIGELEFVNEEGVLDEHLFKMAVECAKYHDCGRENDRVDRKHGLKSAEKMLNVIDGSHSEMDKKMMAVAIEYHEEVDDEYKFDKICKNYELYDEKLKEQTKKLANCLKDADALDRTRFQNQEAKLDEKKLRTKTAKELVTVSESIQARYQTFDQEMYHDMVQTLLIQSQYQQEVGNFNEKGRSLS